MTYDVETSRRCGSCANKSAMSNKNWQREPITLVALPLCCRRRKDASTPVAVYEASALLVHAVLARRQAAVTDPVLAVRELAHRTERTIRSVGSDSGAAGSEVSVSCYKDDRQDEIHHPVSRTTAAEAPATKANMLMFDFMLMGGVVLSERCQLLDTAERANAIKQSHWYDSRETAVISLSAKRSSWGSWKGTHMVYRLMQWDEMVQFCFVELTLIADVDEDEKKRGRREEVKVNMTFLACLLQIGMGVPSHLQKRAGDVTVRPLTARSRVAL